MSSIVSPLAAPNSNRGRSFSASRHRTGLKIVVSAQSAINALLLTYVALTPLLVIPVAGLLGASDVLFFPTLAVVLLIGRLRQMTISHWLLAIFVVLVGFSLHQTREFTYVAKWVRLIGILLPFFLAPYATISLRQVVRVFFWSGLVAIVIGIVLWWFDVVLFEDEANQRLWVESGQSRIRAGGLFGNSGGYGALVAMWTITCGLCAINDRRPNRWALSTVVLTSIVALLASTSRASLLAIIAGYVSVSCFFVAAKYKRGDFRISGSTISLGIVALAVVITTLCVVAPQLMDAQWFAVTLSRFDPFSHGTSDSFLSGRVTIWQDYLSTMDKWGVFGVGYKQGYLHFASSPHNQFLSLGAESGIPSLFVFVFFVLSILVMVFKNWRLKPFESIMCIAVLSGFIADGMGGEPLGSWQVTPITMIMLGICVSQFAMDSRIPVVAQTRPSSLNRK